MKNKNKITGLILLLCTIFINLKAQDKIYFGIDGGVAVFQTKVKNLEGNNFKGQNVYSLAPTGLNINIETGVDWSVEFGLTLQSFVNHRITYMEGDGQGFTLSGGSTGASAYNFKIKRTISLSDKFSVFPFIGFTRISINQQSGYITDYYKISSGSSTVNGVTTKDSTFTQYNFVSNVIYGPEIGFEVSYKILERLNICSNLTYFYNTEYYTQQGVDYFKDGQSKKSAIIYYGGSGIFLQLGLKWNWRDIVKPGTYSIKSDL